MSKAPKLSRNAFVSQSAQATLTSSDRNGPRRLSCARCYKSHLKCSLAGTQAPDRQLGGTEGLHPDDGRCAQCVAANEDCSPRTRKKEEPRSALKAQLAAETDALAISVDHLESLLGIIDGLQPYDPAKLLGIRSFIAQVKNPKAAAEQSVHHGPDSVVSLNTSTINVTDVAQTPDNALGAPATTAAGTHTQPTRTGAVALDSTLTSTWPSTDLHLQYPPPSGIPMYQGNSDSVNPLVLKGSTAPASASRAANIHPGAARRPHMPSFMENATVPGGGGNDALTSSNQAMAITPQYPADLGNIFANATTIVQPPPAPGGPADLDEWSQYNLLLLSLSGNGDGTSAGNDGTAAASSSASNRLPAIEEEAYIPYMTDLEFFAYITYGNAPPPESHAVTHEDFNYFAQDYSTSACQSGSSMQQPPCE
ncbi:hypothetical protein EXIGLDRAFT_775230 [Exidia glandulosa HHB12029]|uniref:Zn(2)-C6 fungal-type domain-containing protein n=1 Tax=Exidia glandulosa HHB12029 TaxID=1314781 RepID=A0A165DZR1_EXIGL|nr:hypothetical protein EXIGLDRAFT_775230 [Exidia glandulosa HHB12029]